MDRSGQRRHISARERGPLLVPHLAGALLLAAAHVATSPGTPIDLEVYRRAGEAVLGGGDQLYLGADGLLPFTYPPFAAVLFTRLALIPAGLATFVIAAVSYASLSTIVVLSIRHLGIDRRLGLPIVLLAALTEPVAETVRFGQVNLVLAALVLVDLLVLMPQHRRAAGLLLAAAISIKLTPAIFLLVPLVRRDWRALARVAAAGAALTLLPAIAMPASWLDFWTRAVWDPDRVGGVEFLANQSLTGAVSRAAGLDGIPALTAVLTVILVLVAIVAVRCGWERDPLAATVVVALCGLLVSPISWVHHWVWSVPLVLWLLAPHRAEAGRHRPLLVGLAAAWLVVLATRVIWLAPSGDGRELSASLPATLLSDAYVLLGVVSLVAVTAVLVTTRPQRNTPASQVLPPEAAGAATR